MLRTIFGIGLLALVGLFVLRVFFGLFGFLFGLLWVLLWWAVKILVLGGVVYLLLKLFLPETARKLKEAFR